MTWRELKTRIPGLVDDPFRAEQPLKALASMVRMFSALMVVSAEHPENASSLTDALGPKAMDSRWSHPLKALFPMS